MKGCHDENKITMKGFHGLTNVWEPLTEAIWTPVLKCLSYAVILTGTV